jgi:Ni,Fe-hydrogenase III large subunit
VSYTLALGPTHPAWRGPQRFALTLDGERVTEIEYTSEQRPGGLVERLPRLEIPEALHRVARACDTCSVAHSLAFCMALEALAGLEVPPRAAALRCCAAELERLVSHLRSAARVLWSLGMEHQSHVLAGLAGGAARELQALAGRAEVADLLLPGGLAREPSKADRDELLLALPKLNRALYREIDRLIDHHALLARTVEVGVLPRAAAEQFGVRGPLARASGITRDARVDLPYALYGQLAVRAITQEGGDVYARLMVLLLEGYESVKLAELLLRDLPDGKWQGRIPLELGPGPASGLVEAPYGPLRYTLEGDGARLRRAAVDAPRQLDRLMVRTLLSGALIDNSVAIIASAGHCPACAEL